MKTAAIEVGKTEVIAMLYLLQDAESGWGEPFKHLDIYAHDMEWDDVDKAVASLIRKLKLASKAVGVAERPVSQ